jgi:hypothetical protein
VHVAHPHGHNTFRVGEFVGWHFTKQVYAVGEVGGRKENFSGFEGEGWWTWLCTSCLLPRSLITRFTQEFNNNREIQDSEEEEDRGTKGKITSNSKATSNQTKAEVFRFKPICSYPLSCVFVVGGFLSSPGSQGAAYCRAHGSVVWSLTQRYTPFF